MKSKKITSVNPNPLAVNNLKVRAEDYNNLKDDFDSVFSSAGDATLSSESGLSSAGPEFTLYRNSPSPAALDVIGQISFDGEDSASNQQEYAHICAAITDPTSGSEDGVLQVYTMHAGANSTYPQLQVSDTAINGIRTDNGATGMAFQLTHVSASPANADVIGYVKFVGYDSGGNTQEYAQISSTIESVTHTAEDGSIQVSVANASVVTEVAEFNKVGLSLTGSLSATVTAGSEALIITSTAQTCNELCYIDTNTAVSSASLMQALTVDMTTTGASAVNMIENARFTVTSQVQNGAWLNALVGKVDFGATGYVTGLAGVVCAELDLPTTNPAGGSGTYTCFEAELNMPTGFTSTVPVSFLTLNAWGAGIANFDTYGYIMDITGVSIASGKVFQANNNTASHALRIRVAGTPYYILLSDTSD